MIKVKIDNHFYPVHVSTFSGGEQHVSLKHLPTAIHFGIEALAIDKTVELHARIQSSKDLMSFFLVHEVLVRMSYRRIEKIVIPYLPYARQDRVTAEDGPFSLKVFSEMLKTLIREPITTYDVHSQAALNLIPQLRSVPQLDIIKEHPGILKYMYEDQPIILAPDKGSVLKATSIATYFQRPLIHAEKERNPSTGDIMVSNIPAVDIVRDRNILIPDDICDGGKTFTELAKTLKLAGAKTVALYVTHGIFSKGYKVFDGLVDRIYTTNTFVPENVPATDEIPVFVHNIVEA